MQTVAAQTDSSGFEEYVHLDVIFLILVKAYMQVVDWVNRLQGITKTATYKMVMGIFCILLFIYYWDIINASYVRVIDSIGSFSEKEMILYKPVQNETHIKYMNDPRFFWCVNNEYLRRDYESLFRLMKDEFMHLKIHNKNIDIFYDSCTKMGVVIAFFPLALNTAWWTNLITFSAALLSKLASDGLIGSPFLTVLRINYGCGGLILTIHFVNVIMGTVASFVKRRLI